MRSWKTQTSCNTKNCHCRKLAQGVIAGKLAQGVGVQHILDEIRNSVEDSLERIHLITRKDIANIEKSYGFQGNKKHDDGATNG